MTAIVLAAGFGMPEGDAMPEGGASGGWAGVEAPALKVCGKPMALLAYEAAMQGGATRCALVVGRDAEWARSIFGGDVEYIVQTEQDGAGGAAMAAFEAIAEGLGTGAGSGTGTGACAGSDDDARSRFIIIYANAPLIRAETVRETADAVESAACAGDQRGAPPALYCAWREAYATNGTPTILGWQGSPQDSPQGNLQGSPQGNLQGSPQGSPRDRSPLNASKPDIPLSCFTWGALAAACDAWHGFSEREKARLREAGIRIEDIIRWSGAVGCGPGGAASCGHDGMVGFGHDGAVGFGPDSAASCVPGGAEAHEFLVVRDLADLAAASSAMRSRICYRLMRERGVMIIDPGNTYIDCCVTVGRGTAIYPGCVLEGSTSIGAGATIGPYAQVTDSVIGDGARVEQSVLAQAEVGRNARVGPYAYLRPGTSIGASAKAGAFVEIKNSAIGAGSKVPHLSYVGDSDIGEGTNIGCGAITCNYDGKSKHRTRIGSNAFVGANVNLIAPVELEDGCYVASGSTVTDRVPAGALAIARARQANKEGWVAKKGIGR